MTGPTRRDAAGALFAAVRDVLLVCAIAVGVMVALDQLPVADPPRPEVLAPRFPGEPSVADDRLDMRHDDDGRLLTAHYDMLQLRPTSSGKFLWPGDGIPRWHFLDVPGVLTVGPAGKKLRVTIHDPSRVRLAGLPACVLDTTR